MKVGSDASSTKPKGRGLRRRNLVKGDQQRGKTENTSSITSHSGKGIGSSLDRFCDALLHWELLEDLKGMEKRATSSSSSKGLSLQNPSNLKQNAPRDCFASFADYLSHWEPLLLMDIKAGVIQGAEHIKENKARCGIVHVCEAEAIEGKSSGMIRMNLSFGKYPNEPAYGDSPGNMDLVLIAGTRGVLPVTQITKDVLERGDYMLALVTSGGGGRDGGVQAKADLARWVRMKDTLLTKDRRASAMKAVATKNAKKSASTTAAAMIKGAEVMSEKRYSDNGRRAAVDMGDADLSMSGKDGLGGVMQGGGKRFRGSAESERVVSNITRVGGLSSYQLHYIVLDRLTSGWREYMALCELPSTTPLVGEILADTPQIHMESTPPQPGNDAVSPFVSDAIASMSTPATGADGEGGGGIGSRKRRRSGSSGGLGTPHSTGSRTSSREGDVELAFSPYEETPPQPPPPPHEPDEDGDVVEERDVPWAVTAHTKKASHSSGDVHVREDGARKTEGAGSVSPSVPGDDDGSTLFVRDIPGTSQGYMGMLRSSFNRSQLLAIVAASEAATSSDQDKGGFTLIQGPPGTGKTSTVVGILNTLHIRAYDDYYEQVVRAVTGPEGVRCRASGLDPSRWLALVAGLSKKKPHILVVAPSNVAVDNIIHRIMERGFCDSKESIYYPSMLRTGGGSGSGSGSGSSGDGRKSPSNPVATAAASFTAADSSSGSAARAVSLEETVEKEQLSAMSEESRAAALETVSVGMRDLIAQLWSVQAALLNMGTAFREYPLPKGWELRCDQESSRPYWVDHRTQTVHMKPPREDQYEHRAATPPLPPPPPTSSSSSSSSSSASATADAVDPRLRRKKEKEEEKEKRAPPPPPRQGEDSGRHVVIDLTRVKEEEGEEEEEDLFGDREAEALRARRELSSHTLRTLPEYAIYCNRVVQIVEQIDRLALFSARCQARMNYVKHGGMQAARQSIEASIIDGAHLVFTTLNSSGHPCLDGSTFHCAVIDEAAQCVEPSSLIPLQRGVRCCILVGDPLQLPATILSEKAKAQHYDRSLFERLLSNGHAYTMLNVQYRMAPAIAAFPAKSFYHGALHNGHNVRDENYCPPYINALARNVRRVALANSASHSASAAADPASSSSSSDADADADSGSFAASYDQYATAARQRSHSYFSYSGPPLLSPCIFFDLHSREAETRTSSKSNPEEAAFCINLVQVLVREAFRLHKGKLGSIGIITPYSEQLSLLRSLCRKHHLTSGSKLALLPFLSGLGGGQGVSGGGLLDIELNTVDAFQGREKDLVIISTVRSNDQGSIGFVSDRRRMNVALTRAKYGLFVVGNASTLRTNTHWGKFIRHVEGDNELIRVDSDTDLLSLLQDSFTFEPAAASDKEKSVKFARFV